MKKLKYLFFIILLILNFINVKTIDAMSNKEATQKTNDYILNAIKDNTWNVTNSETDKDFYDIKINIGNINDNSNLKEAINGVAYSSLTNHSSYKSSVILFGCENSEKCDNEYNFNYNIQFKLMSNDAGDIFLSTTYIVSKDVYNGMLASKKILYSITTNQKGLGGNVVKEGSYSQNINTNEDDVDKTEGRIGNPKVIKNTTTITIPNENDKFWNNAGLNKCYYIKFNYNNPSEIARFSIDNDAKNNIFWVNGNDLSKSIVEDCEYGGVFGVSKNNTYAICNSFGKTYTFKYKDNTLLNVCNNDQKNMAEVQIGEGNTNLLTEKEQEKILEDNKINNGDWNPDKLCDNGDCNIDITKFCNDPYVARTLKFLGLLLAIAKVLVPALIIGLGFVDLAKIVISGKVDEAKKQGIIIIKRVVIGIVIFLIPTILITIYNVAYSIANDSEEVTEGELNVPTNFKNCVGCILDANNKDACIVNTD